MALPNPSIVFTPLTTVFASDHNNQMANVTALAAGTGLNDKAVALPKINGGTTPGVLGTDATGAVTIVPLTFVHLRRTTSQTLPASAQTTVTGLSVVTNTGAATVTTSTIVVPVAGIYLVEASAQLGAENIRSDMTINGVSVAISGDQAFAKLSMSGFQLLTAGASIRLDITNNTATAGSIQNSNLKVYLLKTT